MNIFAMLWRNLWGGSRTMHFPERPKAGAGYRGLVHFNPEHCTGCAICRFRCTSRAIEFKAGKGEFVWSYDPAQCTFCGRCVEGCTEHALKDGHTEHALSQDEECPPIYLTEGELKQSYTVARRAPAAKPAAPKPPAADAPTPNNGEAQ